MDPAQCNIAFWHQLQYNEGEKMLDKTLHKFKQNYRDLLNYTQYHLVDYMDDQIELWSIATKREMVSILIAARLSYMKSVKDRDKKQS